MSFYAVRAFGGLACLEAFVLQLRASFQSGSH
jgi:hypothetical protein